MDTARDGSSLARWSTRFRAYRTCCLLDLRRLWFSHHRGQALFEWAIRYLPDLGYWRFRSARRAFINDTERHESPAQNRCITPLMGQDLRLDYAPRRGFFEDADLGSARQATRANTRTWNCWLDSTRSTQAIANRLKTRKANSPAGPSGIRFAPS